VGVKKSVVGRVVQTWAYSFNLDAFSVSSRSQWVIARATNTPLSSVTCSGARTCHVTAKGAHGVTGSDRDSGRDDQ